MAEGTLSPEEHGLPPASPLEEGYLGERQATPAAGPIRRARSAPRPPKASAAVVMARSRSAPQDLLRFDADAPPNASMSQISRVMEKTRPVLQQLREVVRASELEIAGLREEASQLGPRREPLDEAIAAAEALVKEEELVFEPIRDAFEKMAKKYEAAEAKILALDADLDRAKKALQAFDAQRTALQERIERKVDDLAPRRQAIERIVAAYHDNQSRLSAMMNLEEPAMSVAAGDNRMDVDANTDAPPVPPAPTRNVASSSSGPPATPIDTEYRPPNLFGSRVVATPFTASRVFAPGSLVAAALAGNEDIDKEADDEETGRPAKRLRHDESGA